MARDEPDPSLITEGTRVRAPSARKNGEDPIAVLALNNQCKRPPPPKRSKNRRASSRIESDNELEIVDSPQPDSLETGRTPSIDSPQPDSLGTGRTPSTRK